MNNPQELEKLTSFVSLDACLHLTGMLTKYRTSRWGDSRVCRVHIISMSNQKWIYFVNISQNPMNSDPKYTISCRDPLLKHARNVINLFLEPKNEVYT